MTESVMWQNIATGSAPFVPRMYGYPKERFADPLEQAVM
jgi:hypothetical protein